MPLKNILQSGICYTVIIITASLTSCQAKQAKELIFTIFLLGKFLLSPHSINFQFYLSMSVLFFLLNSSLHSLLQWFSYDFFVQDTWTLALPHYSQRIPLLVFHSQSWSHLIELSNPPASISFFPVLVAEFTFYKSGENCSTCVLELIYFSSYDFLSTRYCSISYIPSFYI